MSWDILDRFPSWGDSGEFPPNGFDYTGGSQVNEKHFDALWNGIKEFETNVRAALTDIDSDQDGVVDAADTAALLKGNDIDSDGDGRIDAADDATTVKNNDIDTDGDGVVNEADSANAYKGNDIDSDGDGKVNAADSADNALSFEARTDYPSNPIDGQVVFRTDKT
jgi:hypothetical protein